MAGGIVLMTGKRRRLTICNRLILLATPSMQVKVTYSIYVRSVRV